MQQGTSQSIPAALIWGAHSHTCHVPHKATSVLHTVPPNPAANPSTAAGSKTRLLALV